MGKSIRIYSHDRIGSNLFVLANRMSSFRFGAADYHILERLPFCVLTTQILVLLLKFSYKETSTHMLY